MSDLSYYFDKIADEFNGYYAGHRPSLVQEIGYKIFRGPGLKKRFLDTIKIIGECKDKEILDVGCGPGIYTQYFAKKGAHITAIDISSKMIELARKNLAAAGIDNLKFVTGDFLKYDFAKTFDYTLAIGLFDYIEKSERDKYMNKLKQLTRKKIIATFPKRLVPQMPIRRMLFFIKKQKVFFYTKGLIFDIAKKNNLKATFYNSGPIWTIEFTKA